jgi:hypothetical protein
MHDHYVSPTQTSVSCRKSMVRALVSLCVASNCRCQTLALSGPSNDCISSQKPIRIRTNDSCRLSLSRTNPNNTLSRRLDLELTQERSLLLWCVELSVSELGGGVDVLNDLISDLFVIRK